MTTQAAAPLPATRVKRRKGRPTLVAHGEPAVWLTGGALSIALAMIVLLLLFIVVQGFATFWPGPIIELRTADGRVFLGEQERVEPYRPGDGDFADLDSEFAAKAKARLEAADGLDRRWLLRTGNFEITDTHFEFVKGLIVVEELEPQWAILAERLEWGRFYGWPKAFLVDGKVQATTAEQVWAQFLEQHPLARQRWRERRKLEQQIGRLNSTVDEARFDVRAVELKHGSSARRQRALDELKAAEETMATQTVALRQRISELARENARYQLVMFTSQGVEKKLALDDVVRAYPANQLSFFEKLGVYFSRWAEFLTDEPRSANSEGGVFPAIFGTVVMTLVMTLAVVPFGVLAALYLREYARAGFVVSWVRISINNLAGVPSIVFGVFGFGFFCYIVGAYIDRGPGAPWQPQRWFVWLSVLVVLAAIAVVMTFFASRMSKQGRRIWAQLAIGLWLASVALTVLILAKTPFFHGFYAARLPNPTFGKGGLIWASLTLALLTLPVVIVATEEALAAVPRSMREGSYACGASKWQTIWRIVLPRAMPGIMTGVILAMARGAGEVAPLMLVGALKLAPDLPLDTVWPFLHPERSFMHLAFHVFDLGLQSPNSGAARPMVFTTTLVLITIIAGLNISAVWIRARLRRRFLASHF